MGDETCVSQYVWIEWARDVFDSLVFPIKATRVISRERPRDSCQMSLETVSVFQDKTFREELRYLVLESFMCRSVSNTYVRLFPNESIFRKIGMATANPPAAKPTVPSPKAAAGKAVADKAGVGKVKRF